MPALLSPEAVAKLEKQHNIWIATVREDGRPHLVPVWFVWHADKIYIGTDPASIKVRNMQQNPFVSLALEDGTHPVICEGQAFHRSAPHPDDLLAAFIQKYEWNLTTEEQYYDVWEITPQKWLGW